MESLRPWSMIEMRPGRVAAVLTLAAITLVGCGGGPDESRRTGAAEPGQPARADAEGPDGRIAFMRGDPAEGDTVTYTVDPDGSDLQVLFDEGPSTDPLWSPDGTEIAIFCCDDMMAAHFVDPATGDLRSFPQPDPALEAYCGGAWSPDGKRITCLTFGIDDPSLNGIYTLRTSDGSGLTRITSNPGGEDLPGDYSPNGQQLVFMRSSDQREPGIFVTDVAGSGVHRISPSDVLVDEIFGGAWSPDGSRILFVARESEDHHKSIWVVKPDGRSPHLLRIEPECGGPFSDPNSAGCYSPSWSPDGQMIVFTRSSPDGQTENIYLVNADGSGLTQVTDGGADDVPDWAD